MDASEECLPFLLPGQPASASANAIARPTAGGRHEVASADLSPRQTNGAASENIAQPPVPSGDVTPSAEEQAVQRHQQHVQQHQHQHHHRHPTRPVPSRLSLRIAATCWRCLQWIGMRFHNLARPWPASPDFAVTIPSTLSAAGGEFKLLFYLPRGHHRRRGGSVSKRRSGHRQLYPAVVNFHGGGFTLGAATDDGRFAAAVTGPRCGAVFVSVEYRLAPEYPFPTAVDDAADAVLWLAAHAEEYGVDRNRLATSGFSAGGNLAITGLLRVESERERRREAAGGKDAPRRHSTSMAGVFEEPVMSVRDGKGDDKGAPGVVVKVGSVSSDGSVTATTTTPTPSAEISSFLSPPTAAFPSLVPSSSSLALPPRDFTVDPLPPFRVVALASFYPITDFTLTRGLRRETSERPDLCLPASMTDLFDASYMDLSTTPSSLLGGGGGRPLDLADPRLSPSRAPDALLAAALPQTVVLVACQWDMLRREAEDFADRLRDEPLERDVHFELVRGVAHGWDKGPNPLRPPRESREVYARCCVLLKEAFEREA